MFNTIIALVILGVFLGIVALMSLYLSGKKSGKKEEQAKQNESIVNEVLDVKKDTVNRRNDSSDDVSNWLRDKGFVRKE